MPLFLVNIFVNYRNTLLIYGAQKSNVGEMNKRPQKMNKRASFMNIRIKCFSGSPLSPLQDTPAHLQEATSRLQDEVSP
jgi:hypothetical protein